MAAQAQQRQWQRPGARQPAGTHLGAPWNRFHSPTPAGVDHEDFVVGATAHVRFQGARLPPMASHTNFLLLDALGDPNLWTDIRESFPVPMPQIQLALSNDFSLDIHFNWSSEPSDTHLLNLLNSAIHHCSRWERLVLEGDIKIPAYFSALSRINLSEFAESFPGAAKPRHHRLPTHRRTFHSLGADNEYRGGLDLREHLHKACASAVSFRSTARAMFKQTTSSCSCCTDCMSRYPLKLLVNGDVSPILPLLRRSRAQLTSLTLLNWELSHDLINILLYCPALIHLCLAHLNSLENTEMLVSVLHALEDVHLGPELRSTFWQDEKPCSRVESTRYSDALDTTIMSRRKVKLVLLRLYVYEAFWGDIWVEIFQGPAYDQLDARVLDRFDRPSLRSPHILRHYVGCQGFGK
ncbi:hypothetical protein K438DRAFT_1787339 [Mycena galopus ATCC 62051]|nr:hypothetical protein K438DRAFT_1787339 [Mycena galopus ATCC 62051]